MLTECGDSIGQPPFTFSALASGKSQRMPTLAFPVSGKMAINAIKHNNLAKKNVFEQKL